MVTEGQLSAVSHQPSGKPQDCLGCGGEIATRPGRMTTADGVSAGGFLASL